MSRRRRGTRVLLAGLGAGAVLAVAALVAVPVLSPAAPVQVPAERIADAVPAPPPGPPLPGAGPLGDIVAPVVDALSAARAAAVPPAPVPPVPRRDDGPLARVIALTNAARADAGCGPLSVDRRLSAAAQGHSDDMAAQGYFSHDSQDGRTFSRRISDAGYPDPGAENIARGQPDAETVMTSWMNSPGHRRNIEDCSLTTIGVGRSAEGNYWTQDFGR